MRTQLSRFLLSSLVFSLAAPACQDDRDDDPASASSASPTPLSRLIPQILPPLDLQSPPEDAAKTSSGLAYKKLASRGTGALPARTDKVLVQYTGWRQRTGETFFTTKGNSEPMTLDIAHSAPGFSEALQLLRKGEKAVLWVPSDPGSSEPLVYEIELVDIVTPAPAASNGKPAATGQPAK